MLWQWGFNGDNLKNAFKTNVFEAKLPPLRTLLINTITLLKETHPVSSFQLYTQNGPLCEGQVLVLAEDPNPHK